MNARLAHKAFMYFMAAALMVIAFAAAAPGLAHAGGVPAVGVGAGVDAGYCLGCHASAGQKDKEFLDGASVRVLVNAGDYYGSVHGGFACNACHEGFSGKVHPDRKYRSRKEYSSRMSRACRSCHADKDIGHVKIHRDLLASQRLGQVPLCQDCHGNHDTAPVGALAGVDENAYCLECHAREMSMKFNDGSGTDLRVDPAVLKGSVHSMLACPDCHFGFTREEHPARNFRSSREFTLSMSEACKRCHFDKFARVSESIHYKLQKEGRTDVPNCSDCHGSHGVKAAHAGKLDSAKRCAPCHEKQYEAYRTSVHGSALIGQGNPDVPVCVDCHSSHDIEDPMTGSYHERIPFMCSGCHGDKGIMDRYGLSTDVVRTYLGDFHGTTLSMYRDEKGLRPGPARSLAECTDCHGTHDITGDFGSTPGAIRANLVQKCRTCHSGAGLDFPDAWLSHYRPSLSHAPLVFIVDMGYRVLMPLMVLGLLLQVVLHVWRYFSNR